MQSPQEQLSETIEADKKKLTDKLFTALQTIFVDAGKRRDKLELNENQGLILMYGAVRVLCEGVGATKRQEHFKPDDIFTLFTQKTIDRHKNADNLKTPKNELYSYANEKITEIEKLIRQYWLDMYFVYHNQQYVYEPDNAVSRIETTALDDYLNNGGDPNALVDTHGCNLLLSLCLSENIKENIDTINKLVAHGANLLTVHKGGTRITQESLAIVKKNITILVKDSPAVFSEPLRYFAQDCFDVSSLLMHSQVYDHQPIKIISVAKEKQQMLQIMYNALKGVEQQDIILDDEQQKNLEQFVQFMNEVERSDNKQDIISKFEKMINASQTSPFDIFLRQVVPVICNISLDKNFSLPAFQQLCENAAEQLQSDDANTANYSGLMQGYYLYSAAESNNAKLKSVLNSDEFSQNDAKEKLSDAITEKFVTLIANINTDDLYDHLELLAHVIDIVEAVKKLPETDGSIEKLIKIITNMNMEFLSSLFNDSKASMNDCDDFIAAILSRYDDTLLSMVIGSTLNSLEGQSDVVKLKKEVLTWLKKGVDSNSANKYFQKKSAQAVFGRIVIADDFNTLMNLFTENKQLAAYGELDALIVKFDVKIEQLSEVNDGTLNNAQQKLLESMKKIKTLVADNLSTFKEQCGELSENEFNIRVDNMSALLNALLDQHQYEQEKFDFLLQTFPTQQRLTDFLGKDGVAEKFISALDNRVELVVKQRQQSEQLNGLNNFITQKKTVLENLEFSDDQQNKFNNSIVFLYKKMLKEVNELQQNISSSDNEVVDKNITTYYSFTTVLNDLQYSQPLDQYKLIVLLDLMQDDLYQGVLDKGLSFDDLNPKVTLAAERQMPKPEEKEIERNGYEGIMDGLGGKDTVKKEEHVESSMPIEQPPISQSTPETRKEVKLVTEQKKQKMQERYDDIYSL